MSMTCLIPALALGLLATAATAQDERCAVPMADWQPREAVRKMAEAQGWQVSRIKIDDGCYEIYARNAEGQRVEASVHPGTLAVINTEIDDHADEDDDLQSAKDGAEALLARLADLLQFADNDDDEDKGGDDDDAGEGCGDDEGDDAVGGNCVAGHRAAPVGTAEPPQNGLFVPGAKPKAQIN